MSTPLIALAVILAVFALVLIPMMMVKGGEEPNPEPRHDAGNRQKRNGKKKKRR